MISILAYLEPKYWLKNQKFGVLLTSRKHTTEFLVKSFGRCCGSTVLTATCYWSSSHCIPVQNFVSVSGELNHTVHHWCWTPTRVCAVTTPLHSLHELDSPGVSKLWPTGQIQTAKLFHHGWKCMSSIMKKLIFLKILLIEENATYPKTITLHMMSSPRTLCNSVCGPLTKKLRLLG